MVDEENLRDWVQQKLDAGVEPSRIKKSLEETGHDPSIVDDVQDPFDVDDAPGDEGLEEEPSMDGGNDDSGGTAPPGDVEDNQTGGEESDSLSSEIGADSLEGGDEEREPQGEPETSGGGGGSLLPSLSMPSLPVWPAAVIAILLVGFAGYMFVPWSSVGLDGVPSFSAPDVELPGQEDETVDGQQQEDECPDVGVRINSVSSSDGSTIAEVLVTKNEAEVVLEVYDSGQLVGSRTETVEGTASMTVDASGDRAVFHPTGCMRYQDSMTIG
jgi:hypothetical protein